MINASLDRCLSFINSQTVPTAHSDAAAKVRRAVTLSRQAGCGAVHVGEKLAHYLQEHAPQTGVKWTIFDRQLMAKVLEDHNLPKHIEKLLPEDRASRVEELLAELFHVHPSVNTMMKLLSETVLQLAELGSVIIIGRGANIVTARLPHVLHVRLVASLEDRIERIARDDHKTPEEARRFCLEEDAARTRYMKTYFNTDINNPLHYHLVLNTSRIGYDNAARMIGEAALRLV